MADGLGNTISGVQVEIGADPGPLASVAKNLDKELAPVKQQLKQIGDTATRSAGGVNAFQQQTARAATGLQGVRAGASQANVLLINMGRATQDMAYGFSGAINNVEGLVTGFQQLKAQTGSSSLALKTLIGSLTGPAGLLFLFSTATTLAIAFGDKIAAAFSKGKEAANDMAAATREALDAVIVAESGIRGVRITPQNVEGVIAATRRELDSLQAALAGLSTLPGDQSSFIAQTQERIKAEQDRLNKLLEVQKAFEQEDATAKALIARGGERLRTEEELRAAKEAANAADVKGLAMLRERIRLLTAAPKALSDRYGELFAQGLLNKRPGAGPEAMPTGAAPGLVGMPTPEEVAKLKAAIDAATPSITAAQVAAAEWGSAMRGAVGEASQIMVDGLSFAIGDAIAGFENLGQSVKRVMQQVVAQVTAAVVRVAILKSLLSLFPGSGFISSLAGASGITQGWGKSSGLVASSAVSGGAVRASQQAIAVRVVPTVLPSGDLLFAAGEGTRRQFAGVLG